MRKAIGLIVSLFAITVFAGDDLVILDNNTVYDAVGKGFYITGNAGTFSPDLYFNVVLRNNISVDSGAAYVDFEITRSGSHCFGSTVASNNISQDASAGTFGGGGFQTNKTAAQLFVSAAQTNFTLRLRSPALNTGVRLLSFTNDNARTIPWRPQYSQWDVGAMEQEDATALLVVN